VHLHEPDTHDFPRRSSLLRRTSPHRTADDRVHRSKEQNHDWHKAACSSNGVELSPAEKYKDCPAQMQQNSGMATDLAL